MTALPAWIAGLSEPVPPPAPPRTKTQLGGRTSEWVAPPEPAPPPPVVAPQPPPNGDGHFRFSRQPGTPAPVAKTPEAELAEVPAAAVTALPALRTSDGPMGRAERLEGLVDKALGRVDEILELPFDPLDENFPRVLTAVKDTSLGVVQLQMKSDENAFRAKSHDGLMGLLKSVLDKEADMNLIDITPEI